MTRRRTALLLLAAMLTVSCASTDDAGAPAGNPSSSTSSGESSRLVCGENLEAILGLLRSGLPTYDYNPAPDLPALVQNADLVVAAHATGLQRRTADDRSWTVVEMSDARVLFGDPDVAIPSEVSFDTQWAVRDEADPLEHRVAIDDLSVVVTLFEQPAAPGGYEIGVVEGFHLGCTGSATSFSSVAAPPPWVVATASIAQLGDAFEAAGDAPPKLFAAHDRWVAVELDGAPLTGGPTIEAVTGGWPGNMAVVGLIGGCGLDAQWRGFVLVDDILGFDPSAVVDAGMTCDVMDPGQAPIVRSVVTSGAELEFLGTAIRLSADGHTMEFVPDT